MDAHIIKALGDLSALGVLALVLLMAGYYLMRVVPKNGRQNGAAQVAVQQALSVMQGREQRIDRLLDELQRQGSTLTALAAEIKNGNREHARTAEGLNNLVQRIDRLLERRRDET